VHIEVTWNSPQEDLSRFLFHFSKSFADLAEADSVLQAVTHTITKLGFANVSDFCAFCRTREGTAGKCIRSATISQQYESRFPQAAGQGCRLPSRGRLCRLARCTKSSAISLMSFVKHCGHN